MDNLRVIEQNNGKGFFTNELLGQLNDVEERNKPDVLYARGEISLLRKHPKVSIVGSRKCSEDGIKRAYKLTRLLAQKGVIIVSGLALGVDSIAHQTAIKYGTKTIAVLGTPLDVVYPKENKELHETIGESHLLLSQFKTGSSVQKKNFPIRNRTMALISDGTFIIEAQDKSGTLHQGWEALRLGRPVFILESSYKNSSLRWVGEFIKYGAQVVNDSNLDEALDQLLWCSDEEMELNELPF